MNLEAIQAEVAAALEPGFRAQLLARGQARSMVLRDGMPIQGSPQFAATLPYDLTAYGEALLLHAVRIRSGGGNETLARRAFIQAAEAIEAVVTNGSSADPERGLLRMLSAVAFHLGRSSARAYSMLRTSLQDANLSRLERALALLILRSVKQLEREIRKWQVGGLASDETLVEHLAGYESQRDNANGEERLRDSIIVALDTALCERLYSGLGIFLLALETGDGTLVARAREDLQRGLAVTSHINLVPQWWCFRLAIHLIDDIWQASFHRLLPKDVPDGDNHGWRQARALFIGSLYRRDRAEIDLWPSQIEGARRAVDPKDNLVVSLPTSAGKTRVAELCMLRCLSEGKRVVFVTPLRALSAQTESALRKTFAPLGKSVSALYGSMGASAFEEDTLRSRDIVVATPEKLDFAVRNDPSILDDVGLVVLDEGHMIGYGEREIRYEVQIQRLLNRPDAQERRIVCLSAVLPSGDELADFVNWIRNDRDGGAVKSDWRPTRHRFGEVLWRDGKARLELMVAEERPFIPTFFEPRAPLRGRRKAAFPRDQMELALGTAWRLLEDGHSVIIYCPERRSVGAYAKAIVDLASKGFIDTALRDDKNVLETALAIGGELLGPTHPIVGCLRLGVAVHHGALPGAFRKELERLLRDGVLQVTVSSPTLAQGLNLTATSIIMHSIEHYRDGTRKTIPASDFANIVGRAGRAFVDVEGLVLFPIWKRLHLRRRWRQLIDGKHDLEMNSGMLQLVILLLQRLNRSLGNPGIDEVTDYVLNNSGAWEFPQIPLESDDQSGQAMSRWHRDLAILDSAVLSLVDQDEVSVDELSVRLDEVLSSSLWERQMARYKERSQTLLRDALVGRARFIWGQSTAAQRRGYFLAGVGLVSGQALDTLADELNPLLIEANAGILEGDSERAVGAVVGLAERLFAIEPFVPSPFPEEWREVLERWLSGKPLEDGTVGQRDDLLRFVENGLVYKLSWAVDAVRVRALANRDNVGTRELELTVDDIETGLLVPCLETGTLDPCAARLMQAGFGSRSGATKAVADTNADFVDMRGMMEWLRGSDVVAFSADPMWPTVASHPLWLRFINRYGAERDAAWSVQRGEFRVAWSVPDVPAVGKIVRLQFADSSEGVVLSPTFRELGVVEERMLGRPAGVFHAKVGEGSTVRYEYRGPTDIVVDE